MGTSSASAQASLLACSAAPAATKKAWSFSGSVRGYLRLEAGDLWTHRRLVRQPLAVQRDFLENVRRLAGRPHPSPHLGEVADVIGNVGAQGRRERPLCEVRLLVLLFESDAQLLLHQVREPHLGPTEEGGRAVGVEETPYPDARLGEKLEVPPGSVKHLHQRRVMKGRRQRGQARRFQRV